MRTGGGAFNCLSICRINLRERAGTVKSRMWQFALRDSSARIAIEINASCLFIQFNSMERIPRIFCSSDVFVAYNAYIKNKVLMGPPYVFIDQCAV